MRPAQYVADGDSAGTGFPLLQPLPTSHNLSQAHLAARAGHAGDSPASQNRGAGSQLLELEPSRVLRRPSEVAGGPRQAQPLRPGAGPEATEWAERPEEALGEGSPAGPAWRRAEHPEFTPGGLAVPRVSKRGSEFPDSPPVHSWHLIGDRPEEGGGAPSPGSRVWSREHIAQDPKGYLMRMLDPFLPPDNGRAREQVGLLVAQTLQSVESAIRASFDRERQRALEAHSTVQEELRALQEDLHATERNRAELAALLEATIATTQAAVAMRSDVGAAANCEHASAAAVRVQRAWRRARTRRLSRDYKRPVEPYDVIVCFDSLSSTIDAANMRIEILRWAHTTFNIHVAEREGLRIVAHMGLFDKGKTFLINQFYGKNLPSGKLHETTGLSMIYVPKQRFLVIDTKGLQAPVSYKTKGVKQLVDASQTEIFLFELVSRIAHYIIFVVNDFTWPEQRNIVQLHQKYVQSKRENQLIVAHNLRTTRSVHEAVELFCKQVASKYEGVERSELGGLIFTVDEKPRIHHIGFAEAHSPAGRKFNAKNTAHLLQLLDQLEGIGERQRSVAQLLEEHFAALLPEFVFLESASGQRLDGAALKVASELDLAARAGGLEPDEERDPTAYRAMGSLVLEVPEDHRVHMKTEGVFSEFCELVAQDITFKPPPPNVYEQRLKDKLVRLIEFEIPGVHRKDITFKKGNRGFTVTMSRTKDKGLANYGVAPRFQAPRIPTGEFSFDLFFDDGLWELDGGREAVSHENGLLRVRMKQDLMGEVFTLETL